MYNNGSHNGNGRLKNGELLKSRIVSTLRARPHGLTIHELSSILGVERHTLIKYLMELKGAGQIIQRPVGSAILHYLNHHPESRVLEETA